MQLPSLVMAASFVATVQPPIKSGSRFSSAPGYVVADCRRLTALGWEPEVSLTEGLRQMAELAGQTSSPSNENRLLPLFSQPQRARGPPTFPVLCSNQGLEFDLLKDVSNGHDLVIFSSKADIVAWTRFPVGGPKLVYELIDSQLALPKDDFKSGTY